MNTEQFDELRRLMVMEIASTTVMVGERIGKYNLDARVMEVMGKVERQQIVPHDLQHKA
jgi:hypothetical protein